MDVPAHRAGPGEGPRRRRRGPAGAPRAAAGALALLAVAVLLGSGARPPWDRLTGDPAPARGTDAVPGPGTGPVRWPLPRSCSHSPGPRRAPTAADRDELDGDGLVEAAYYVRAGRLQAVTSGSPDPCHELLWRLVHHLYPAQAVELLDRFVVVGPSQGDEAGDEVQDDLGFVRAEDATLQSWTLALSTRYLTDEDIAVTALHELGHLLSLGPQAVEAGSDAQDCATWATSEGCTRQGGLFDTYLDTQWGRPLWEEWERASDADEGPEQQLALRGFYQRHRDRFPTEYAASSPEEDFAEVFAYWCLAPGPDAAPLATPALRRAAAFLSARADLADTRRRCDALD